VNNTFDWWRAEHLLERGEASLPRVGHTPWTMEN
jgi:hypothetical protein